MICLWNTIIWRHAQRILLPNTDTSVLHHFCPVILFVDASTLADRIGWLKVEPILCSFGDICGEKRRLACFFLVFPGGFIPPYPKSSAIEVAGANRAKLDSKHDQITYYHQCLKSFLQDLLSMNEIFVSRKEALCAHFKLSLVISDTEGHDQICTHYYCSYSSNIIRMPWRRI